MKKIGMLIGMLKVVGFIIIIAAGNAYGLDPFGGSFSSPFGGNVGGGMIFGGNIEDQILTGSRPFGKPFGGNAGGGMIFGVNTEDLILNGRSPNPARQIIMPPSWLQQKP
jgi:hypothetical protein